MEASTDVNSSFLEKTSSTIQMLAKILGDLSCNHYVPFLKKDLTMISNILRREKKYPSFIQISLKNGFPFATFSEKSDADSFSDRYESKKIHFDSTNKVGTANVDMIFYCKGLNNTNLSKIAEALDTRVVKYQPTPNGHLVSFATPPIPLLFLETNAIFIKDKVVAFDYVKKINCKRCFAPGHANSQCTLNESELGLYKKCLSLKSVYHRFYEKTKAVTLTPTTSKSETKTPSTPNPPSQKLNPNPGRETPPPRQTSSKCETPPKR